ncbi:MAG: site-2 protease family protein [Candidatus Cloacimonetes bacterium]|nr:site-2 protease family protein [Candidatus Cloacimonadota bacterium]
MGFSHLRFSQHELQELLKSWAVLSFAFAIVLENQALSSGFLEGFFLSGLTVGVAFLFHEMGHKFVAQKFGCWAEFRAFDWGLLLAVFMALFMGRVFAAPGAVFIGGQISREQSGKIAVFGPLTNIFLAGIFFVLLHFFGEVKLFLYGYNVNSGLAFFNLWPFLFFDGFKIFLWRKEIWLLLMLTATALVFLG